ncbi:MAG: primosomal replication protein N [Candidatus Arsenophonus melophagi]|nr:primosomal replication protein N [Candidatus Arsenophonus melophagi]
MVVNTNQLVLSGKICNVPIRTVSPAGIPHCKFVMEHFSQKKEANFNRKVWCRITTIASGQQLQKFTSNITVGSWITVIGFISSHQGLNGLNQLVLHAEKITLIDFGE